MLTRIPPSRHARNFASHSMVHLFLQWMICGLSSRHVCSGYWTRTIDPRPVHHVLLTHGSAHSHWPLQSHGISEGNVYKFWTKIETLNRNLTKTHYFNKYEGCSNMNASGFISFFTYMLRQNGKRFYKGLYVTFKVAPDQKKNTVYLSSYSSLNEGHVCILTNSMLRTYTSDRDECIILRRTGEISWNF